MVSTQVRPPQRWEYAASAVATAAAAATAVATEDLAELTVLVRHIDSIPGWLRAVVSVPQPVWWGLTVVAGALLYWLGTRLARRWGSIALLLAPAVMLALQYVVPWLLYAPIRAALPGAGA